MLGIEAPIILGGMTGVGTPELCAAVSNAGGLGTFAAHNAGTPENLKVSGSIFKLASITQDPKKEYPTPPDPGVDRSRAGTGTGKVVRRQLYHFAFNGRTTPVRTRGAALCSNCKSDSSPSNQHHPH